MRKTKHDINIFGTTFETNDNDEIVCNSFDDIRRRKWEYNTIWDAYNNPSDAKESIWNEWNEWFCKNWAYGDAEWWISGKTCNFFTISGKVRMNNGDMWYLRITYAHNYATRIVEQH